MKNTQCELTYEELDNNRCKYCPYYIATDDKFSGDCEVARIVVHCINISACRRLEDIMNKEKEHHQLLLVKNALEEMRRNAK